MIDNFNEEKTPYRKKAVKSTPTKSKHKHEYELVQIEPASRVFSTHREVCKICGKERNKFYIEGEEIT